MIGDVFISDHAVERFIKRHAPDMSFNAAKSLLVRRALNAVPLKAKTIKGDHQWRISDPDVILVGKYVQNKIVCKTILPEPENSGIPEEEMEMLLERMEEDERVIEAESRLPSIEQRLQEQLTSEQLFELEQRRIAAEKKVDMQRLQVMREFASLKNKEVTFKNRDLDALGGAKRSQLADALRKSITFIMQLKGNRDADFVLAEIQRICPEFVSTKFLKS